MLFLFLNFATSSHHHSRGSTAIHDAHASTFQCALFHFTLLIDRVMVVLVLNFQVKALLYFMLMALIGLSATKLELAIMPVG